MGRKFKLYVISNKPLRQLENVNDIGIYTVVSSAKECTEYVNQYLKVKNIEHFNNWCDAHHMNKEDVASWHVYCANVIQDQFRDFCITRYKLNTKKLTSLLRLSLGCVPLGCEFETYEERLNFIETNFTEDEINELDNAIDKAIEKELKDYGIE